MPAPTDGTKGSALPAASAVTADDLHIIVNDPAGTPVMQRATHTQLLAFISSGLGSIFQPLDSDLTAIAALATTAYGRALLALADAAALRTAGGLGTAATANKVAAGVAGVLDATDATTTNARAPTAHAHPESDVTGLVTDLALKAPLASPALTGVPTAPTAVNATDSTQLATTAFVHALITALLNAAPANLDTLGEIATQLASDESALSALITSVSGKLTKASNLSDLTDAAVARTNLGVAIGSNVQAWDADLDAVAAIATTAYGRALLALADAAALRTAGGLGGLAVLSSITASLISDASANGRSLIAAADYAAMRSLLSLAALALKSTIATADIDADAVTYAKIQNVSATDKVLGRSTAGAGDVEEIAFTAAMRALADDASAAAQRVTIGLDQRTAVSNADYTILATDRYVAQTGTLSAARTFTLPAANAVNAGQQLTIADESGSVTFANTITIARAGSDSINGTTSYVIALPYARIRLISNGSNAWALNWDNETIWRPQQQKLLAAAYDPTFLNTNTLLAGGVLSLIKLFVPWTISATNILAYVGAAGVTLTASQCWAALIDDTGTRLGVTAEQSTPWQSTGLKTMALTSGPISVAGGPGRYCYVVLLGNGSTLPGFQRASGVAATNNAGLVAADGYRFGNLLTGQTTIPTSITIANIATANASYWAGLN